MFARLPKLSLVAALACSVGLHWAVLQSIAWLGMLVAYSQEAPLSEALLKTFDGKHPCALCKEIARKKHSEDKSASNPPVQKLEFSYFPIAFVFAPPSNFWNVGWLETSCTTLAHAPPVPPPKRLPG